MVELTPKLFVDKTLDMLPRVMEKMAEAIKKNKAKLENATGPQEAMQVIFEIILELRSEIGEEILPEGITSEDMESFKTEHEAEIQEYLNSNPKVKEKWDNLQQEMQEKFQSIFS